MKKILTILGIITLIGINTTNLVSCNKQYSEIEIKELKAINNINIKDSILEGILPQEKPFKQVNNKYYFVIGRGNKNDDGKIIKLIHNELKIGKIFDKYNKYTLELREETGYPFYFTLYVRYSSFGAPADGESDNGTYFKSVYLGNYENQPNIDVENKLKSYLDL